MASPYVPQFKINLGGTDYTSEAHAINVKLRENNYSVATIILDNYKSKFYTSLVDTFDEVKIYFKDSSDVAYTQVFGGYVRELLPAINTQNSVVTLGCKGYGAALDETHCNRDYGTESANPSYPQPFNIWTNVLSDFVNKSFDDWSTGHALTYAGLITNAYATDITYINNPYRKNTDVINHVCDLVTAINAGADAENPTSPGVHWIVDPTKQFILNTIGSHEDPTEWPDWWNTDQTGSTLVEGIDFESLQVIDKSSEFANNIILITDFRRPSYDSIFTEDASGDWDAEAAFGAPAWTADINFVAANPTPIVGSNCLKVDHDDNVGVRSIFWPSTANAAWDVTKWGSLKNPPRFNFYFYKYDEMNISSVRLFTTDFETDYWELDVSGLVFFDDPDETWVFHSIPIGAYHANVLNSQEPLWEDDGSPDWTDINGVAFQSTSLGADDYYALDDMHFSGQIIRSAYVSDNITANKEYQKVFISRNSMDDSCVWDDDTGDAGRIAKAELLRRIANPLSVQFTVGLKKGMMAGQKLHVHALRKPDYSYAVNSDMRALVVEHNMVHNQSATTTVTATSDLYNTRPISSTDKWALQQEFLLVNSGEAKNIRSGAEVDLLVPLMKKNYT